VSDRLYKIRYMVEEWNKPAGSKTRKTEFDGIKVSTDNYGYTDELLVASILHDEKGEIKSIGLFSSEGRLMPSRKLLEAVKSQIEHQLEHHAE
jgi:hypothetical protein